MARHSSFATADLPIALQLVAACCDNPVTPETEHRIARLAEQVDDWTQVQIAACRQQVQGFVQERLSANTQIPEPTRERWAQEARQRAAVNLTQARATIRLHALLNHNGIDNLVLKGLPLADAIYGSLTIKRSSDIDLLVAPENLWKAVQLLSEEGFVVHENDQRLTEAQAKAVLRHFKEITLRNDANIIVDLHWRLIENPSLLTGLDPFKDARTVEFQSIGSLAVMSEADEFAYLCVHGALSDWSRLKWLADVNALIGVRPDADLLRLYEHADRFAAGVCTLQALKLRQAIWGKRLPPELEQRWDSANMPPDILAFPVGRMMGPYLPASSRDAIKRILGQTRVRARLYRSRARAIMELQSHLYALPEILALPLPRWLDWLYIPLRPAFWLMRKLRR